MSKLRESTPLGDYTIVVKESGDQYVTLCLELSVAGCGDTQQEALENTRLAIESYLEAMKTDALSPSRPVPLDVLHEFLTGESEEREQTVPTEYSLMVFRQLGMTNEEIDALLSG